MNAIEQIEYIGLTNREMRLERLISLIEQPYIIEADSYSRNIIIPARKQIDKIAITAHWDAFPGSKGFNDNASGVVTLIRLQNAIPDNFEIVFMDNEERAGMGSSLYLSNNKPSANINIDVVGLGNKIFFDKFGAFNLNMPDEGVTEYRGMPFSDSTIFARENIPSIIFVTGTRGKDLIREIWECQHGMKNDNRLELISEKALEKIYAYLQEMINLNVEVGIK